MHSSCSSSSRVKVGRRSAPPVRSCASELRVQAATRRMRTLRSGEPVFDADWSDFYMDTDHVWRSPFYRGGIVTN